MLFSEGNINTTREGKFTLSEKPAQTTDTCWFEGPMMLANLSLASINSPEFDAIKQYKEETGALYLLEYCFKNFITQFDSEKLLKLAKHHNMLSINFPEDFINRLGRAIHSPQRKELLTESLILAATSNPELTLKSFTDKISKIIFDLGHECLNKIGMEVVADNVFELNSSLLKEHQYNQFLRIMQKDSIIEYLLKQLTISENPKFTSAQDLFALLCEKGPLLIRAQFGIDSYVLNSAYLLNKIENIHILGWNKNDFIDDKNSYQHYTVIIGMKYNADAPESSRVYFVDPRQTMNPNQKKDVYSVSFAKYNATIAQVYYLSGYKLTADIVTQLEQPQDRLSFKKGFFEPTPNTLSPEKKAHDKASMCTFKK